jgi:thiol:disulfide interchange protein
MNRKITLLLIGISLLACNFLFPRNVSDYNDPAPTEFTIVRLHPGDGNLQAMLTEQAQKASTLGQMPVVEFDATWCPPCKAIDQAIKEKNELMVNAYAGTYIIKLDVDEWGWGDSLLHDFEFAGIPVYFKLDAQGHQTGEVVDAGAWAENIPENMAPVMDEFFHSP